MTEPFVGVDFATVTRIPVPFAGGRDRTGPLTQGQANMRRCVLRDDPAHMNLRVIWPLPAGTSVTQVVDAVRAQMLRHESLRTTYPEDPELRQQVAGAGLLEVLQYRGDGRLEPAALAKEIGRGMCAVRFDPPAEFPLRVAVVSEDAIPTHIVIVLCHMAADAAALGMIAAEWDGLISGRPLGPPASLQPLDLTEMEHAPAGQRRTASSLRYWEGLLRRAPQATFAVSGAAETDWMIQPLRVRSQRAAGALGLIEARTGAGRSTIMLAVMCVLVAHRIAHRSLTVTLLSANRYLPELADYIGTLAQDALMSIELGGSTFDEVVRQVRGRSFTAYRHSWFDSNALWEVIAETGRSRGTNFARDCVFNDLSTLSLDGLQFGPPRSTDRYDTAMEAELSWLPPESMPTRLMLWAVRLDHEVELFLWADHQIFSKGETEGFARGIVRLLLAAAERDIGLDGITEMSGIRPVTRGSGWYLVDSCWIDLGAVSQLLADVVGDRPFLVEPVADEQLGHRLVCYVAADDPGVPSVAGHAAPNAVPGGTITPEWVHAGCMARLSTFRPAAIAPHHYVVCAMSGDGHDAEAFRLRPVVIEGSGRGDSTVPGAHPGGDRPDGPGS